MKSVPVRLPIIIPISLVRSVRTVYGKCYLISDETPDTVPNPEEIYEENEDES